MDGNPPSDVGENARNWIKLVETSQTLHVQLLFKSVNVAKKNDVFEPLATGDVRW